MNAFTGTRALLGAQLKPVRNLVWILGGLALFTGALMRLGAAGQDAIQFTLLMANVLGLLVGPLLGGTGLTLPVTTGGVNNGGFLRRDQLLLLPIGRLAVPATVFAGSLCFYLAVLCLAALGMSLTLGPVHVWKSATFTLNDAEALTTVFGSLGAWLVLTSVAAIGAHQATTAVLWLVPLFGLLGLLPAMGYGDDHQALFAALVGAPMAVLFLVLPFVLYQRPRHLWFLAKKDMTARFDGRSAVAALLALFLFGMGGASWAALGALLAALPVARAWRRVPPSQRQQVSHLRLVHGAFAVVTTASLLVCAALDAAFVARSEDPARGNLEQVTLAPGGRYLALQVWYPTYGGGSDQHLRRVHVIDLLGQQPPRALPPRFAALPTDETEQPVAWSRDGRYLGYLDRSFGRLCFGVQHTPWLYAGHHTPWEKVMVAWAASTVDAYVLDLQTGESQLVEGAVFAPGWSSPDQLVRLSVDLQGRIVVSTGQGAELRLDPEHSQQLLVAGYTPDGPLLETTNRQELAVGRPLRLIEGFGAERGDLTCLTRDGARPPQVQTEGWRVEWVWLGDQESESTALKTVATDGERTYVFPHAEGESPLGQPVAGRLFVLADGGSRLRELELATGVWRDVARAAEGGRVVDVHLHADGVFFRNGPRWFWARPGEPEPRQLPAWVLEPQGWTQDGALLAKNLQGRVAVGSAEREVARLGRGAL